MLLIPAIDLKDGHCVRLEQGDMDKATVFSEDPGAMAAHWISKGARRLHLVDLNGALTASSSAGCAAGNTTRVARGADTERPNRLWLIKFTKKLNEFIVP